MIRVFPRRTTATPIGDNVFVGGPPLFPVQTDMVAISCTFTWDKPECERLQKEWRDQGYRVTIGGPAYDNRGEDFIPGQFLKEGYVITSRGCNNKCWFCSAWRREGPIRELPITQGWNVLDSNLLQCKYEHVLKVFKMLAKQKQKPAFTGGLEAAKLRDWHVDALTELKPKSVYFAYDTPDDYEPLQVASRKLNEAGIVKKTSHVVMCYVLIGYPRDTIAQAEKRLKDVLSMGITPMAMLYRDQTGKFDYEWRRFQRTWARPCMIHSKKMA